jgi:uncharacterized alpha-E superfamily protein
MTQAAILTTSQAAAPRLPRALLARVADASYWMSRYIERAEHIARILMVSVDSLTGAGELEKELSHQAVVDVLKITWQEHMLPELVKPDYTPMQALMAVAKYMALDPSNPISLMSCLTKARENARSIRESISNEMWEQLNTLYWSLKADDAMARFDDSPQEFFRQMMTGSLLLQGLADQTIDHGQVWLFIQLSKYLERADMTCRILLAKFQTLHQLDSLASLDPAGRIIHWMAVLRACCSIEAYRRANVGEIEPALVAGFILFEPTFPRSVHFCIHHALESVDRIRSVLVADAGRDAQRRLGRLFAELQYSRAAPTQDKGLLAFLEQIRNSAADASIAVQEQWLMRSGEQASRMELVMG